MGSRNETTQLVTSFSVPREDFLSMVAMNPKLNRKDFAVVCFLLTQLEGWNEMRRTLGNNKTTDPMNFRKIHVGNMATLLQLSKEDVRESIRKLVKLGILSEGSSVTVKRGYRFTF